MGTWLEQAGAAASTKAVVQASAIQTPAFVVQWREAVEAIGWEMTEEHWLPGAEGGMNVPHGINMSKWDRGVPCITVAIGTGRRRRHDDCNGGRLDPWVTLQLGVLWLRSVLLCWSRVMRGDAVWNDTYDLVGSRVGRTLCPTPSCIRRVPDTVLRWPGRRV